jgi:hypothetical protein
MLGRHWRPKTNETGLAETRFGDPTAATRHWPHDKGPAEWWRGIYRGCETVIAVPYSSILLISNRTFTLNIIDRA